MIEKHLTHIGCCQIFIQTSVFCVLFVPRRLNCGRRLSHYGINRLLDIANERRRVLREDNTIKKHDQDPTPAGARQASHMKSSPRAVGSTAWLE